MFWSIPPTWAIKDAPLVPEPDNPEKPPDAVIPTPPEAVAPSEKSPRYLYFFALGGCSIECGFDPV